ncbi:MAG: sortase [Patescibacteria group bacterium]|nr:sortase [Patescibacteria group bacterium]
MAKVTKVIKNNRWRNANRLLLTAILLINGYIILAPMLPNLMFAWQTRGGSSQSNPQIKLAHKIVAEAEQGGTASKTSGDALIIPRMVLDTSVVEGKMSNSYANLNKGAWRLPIGSTPAEGGNTVIAGHRFSYTGPRGIFYYLDKLKIGDEIGYREDGVMYRYAVESVRTVPATEVSIQQPTTDARLTLYTCTPLWNPVNRLVVVAKPLGEPSP